MKSIITLIIVAIVIVAIKELIAKKIQKSSDKLANKKLNDETLKSLSKNFIEKMIFKVGWFHLAFFISAIVGGAITTINIALSVVYILLIIVVIAYSIRQQKKYYESFGDIEAKLTINDKSALQRMVNTDKTLLSKKEKQFLESYKTSEKRFGIPLTIITLIQVVISLVMWIGTF